MDVSKIFSIPGKPGLAKLISNNKSGAVMESLVDGNRFQIYTSDKVSSLAEIQIYTNGEEVPLADVFVNIFKKENGGQTTVSADDTSDKLKQYMDEILPDWDKGRVYVSDLKKLVKWYNILQKHNLIDIETNKSDDEVPEV